MTFPMLRALTIAAAAWAALSGAAGAQEAVSLSKIVEGWAASGHADAEAEAFAHWNAEGEIPPQCAVCHAGAGFRDFHGLDGSAPGLEAPIPVGGVVDCDTCHVEGLEAITEIAMPSGVASPVLENAATCMTCHQGRNSGPSVARSIDGMAPDEVNPELSFINPHYAAAAATLLGGEARGLFEYPGQSYVGRFDHVGETTTCTSCHDPHALTVAVENCAACHAGASSTRAIRASAEDFDGDGDNAEGIAGELETLRAILAEAIAVYGAQVAGTPVVYHSATYPYFFTDLDGDGAVGAEEAVRDNRYASWTPRMLVAAYNYQFAVKDPGAYAHNPRYVIQALHDSIADLASAMDWQPPALARP